MSNTKTPHSSLSTQHSFTRLLDNNSCEGWLADGSGTQQKTRCRVVGETNSIELRANDDLVGRPVSSQLLPTRAETSVEAGDLTLVLALCLNHHSCGDSTGFTPVSHLRLASTPAKRTSTSSSLFNSR
jgi:hypothetical protein